MKINFVCQNIAHLRLNVALERWEIIIMGQVKAFGESHEELAEVYSDQGYNVMLREPTEKLEV